MKSLRAFTLGVVLSALYTPLAMADGYYEDDGGLYWSVRGGLSQVRNSVGWNWGAIDPVLNSHSEWRSLEMDYGLVAGASIGYTALFPDSPVDLRIEAEAIYRRNADGQINSDWVPTSNIDGAASLGYETAEVDGSLEVRSAMANFMVDFHTPTRFTPYVGIGAGISQLVAKGWIYDVNRAVYGYPYPQRFDETLYALSVQGIVGVGFHLSAGTMITAEVRTFRLASDRWSELFQTSDLSKIKFDDWSLGLRLTF
jgi:opacity protein-like surface antigen